MPVPVAGGGTALASYVVSSNSRVGPGTISGHKPPSGKHVNIIAGSINGTDIADRSGVDTCQSPLVAKFGPICAGSDAGARTWNQAVNYCAGLDLRLPSLAEALALAGNHLVPGVSPGQSFWTDERWIASSAFYADTVTKAGVIGDDIQTSTNQTVCVTDPSA